jgi:hypothetical protein
LIRRRTETPLTPQQFFDEVLLSPLFWPGKTVRLERDSLIDYRHRSLSSSVSISELYHENSKLFPQILPELMATILNADSIRSEFVQRRAIVGKAGGTAPFELEQRYRELLFEVARWTSPDLLYAVELRVVEHGVVAAYEPVCNVFQVVKRLSVSELNVLRGAVRLFESSNTSEFTGPILILLGSFARNELLFGRRGYRRTLLEAGRVAQEVCRCAQTLGIEAIPTYEFTDRELDLMMEADGVEQGTLFVFELNGETRDGV